MIILRCVVYSTVLYVLYCTVPYCLILQQAEDSTVFMD